MACASECNFGYYMHLLLLQCVAVCLWKQQRFCSQHSHRLAIACANCCSFGLLQSASTLHMKQVQQLYCASYRCILSTFALREWCAVLMQTALCLAVCGTALMRTLLQRMIAGMLLFILCCLAFCFDPGEWHVKANLQAVQRSSSSATTPWQQTEPKPAVQAL